MKQNEIFLLEEKYGEYREDLGFFKGLSLGLLFLIVIYLIYVLFTIPK